MTIRPLLLATLALSTLSGCGGANRGIETAHQPVVTRSDYVLDLLAGPDGLAPGEPQRLRGWMDALRLGYGDTIAVDDANGLGGGARADVAALAGSYGLRVGEGAAATGAPVPPGMVRVVIGRARANVPSCSVPHTRAELANFDAHMSPDFGCAVNGNLAAMVANPTDLVRGVADDGDHESTTATKAVVALRKAAPSGAGGTALKTESSGGR